MAIHYPNGSNADVTTVTARRPVATFTTLLGAALSLALVAGGVVWSVKLIIRDVSGVPVVRAMAGPVRELPADPGGTAADNMGLAVNTIAAEGMAAPTPDALTLAPAPVELVEEDAPLAELAKIAERPAPEVTVNSSVAAMVADLTANATPLAALTVAGAGAGQSTADAPARAEAEVQSAALASETSRDPTPLGEAESLRPRERPAALSRVRAEPVDAAVTAALLAVDPDTIPPGTRMAQLGAFETPEIAAREWERLGLRFGDYLAGKSRVIQEAQSGGRTFFRLRAHGFEDLEAASRFCAALSAERAECIPVVTR